MDFFLFDSFEGAEHAWPCHRVRCNGGEKRGCDQVDGKEGIIAGRWLHSYPSKPSIKPGRPKPSVKQDGRACMNYFALRPQHLATYRIQRMVVASRPQAGGLPACSGGWLLHKAQGSVGVRRSTHSR